MRRLANYTFQGWFDQPHMVAQSARVATQSSDESQWLRNAGWQWPVSRLLIWLKLMWFRWLCLWDVGYGIISCKFWHCFWGSRQGTGANSLWLVHDRVTGNTRATEDSIEPTAELTRFSVLFPSSVSTAVAAWPTVMWLWYAFSVHTDVMYTHITTNDLFLLCLPRLLLSKWTPWPNSVSIS